MSIWIRIRILGGKDLRKNYTKKCSTKSVKITYKRILTFKLPVQNSPNETVHFLGSGSASLHADPDPGGLLKCGSMRIRIRNTASKLCE